jgi:hypothetical protein
VIGRLSLLKSPGGSHRLRNISHVFDWGRTAERTAAWPSEGLRRPLGAGVILSGSPVIMVEHSAQPLAALDRSERVRCCEFRKDQLIVEPLMVPLMMVVDDELLNGTA